MYVHSRMTDIKCQIQMTFGFWFVSIHLDYSLSLQVDGLCLRLYLTTFGREQKPNSNENR